MERIHLAGNFSNFSIMKARITTVKEMTKEQICELLNNHKVDYLLIGGLAVVYHGYTRSTNFTTSAIPTAPDTPE